MPVVPIEIETLFFESTGSHPVVTPIVVDCGHDLKNRISNWKEILEFLTWKRGAARFGTNGERAFEIQRPNRPRIFQLPSFLRSVLLPP